MPRSKQVLAETMPEGGSGEAEADVPKQGGGRGGTAVVRRLEHAMPALAAVRIESLEEATRTVTLRVGAGVVPAALDAQVELPVIRTALARGERVIAQLEGAGWVVLGALRTTATPGVDEGDEFVIKARRVEVVSSHEISLVSGTAGIAIRALGQVETLARDITARASGIHKLIGRMIRLN